VPYYHCFLEGIEPSAQPTRVLLITVPFFPHHYFHILISPCLCSVDPRSLTPGYVSPTLPCHVHVPVPSILSFLSDSTVIQLLRTLIYTSRRAICPFIHPLSNKNNVHVSVKMRTPIFLFGSSFHPRVSPITSSPFTFSISSPAHLEPRPWKTNGTNTVLSPTPLDSPETHKRQRGSHFFFFTHSPYSLASPLTPPLPFLVPSTFLFPIIHCHNVCC
jgi:hypothetical protein